MAQLLKNLPAIAGDLDSIPGLGRSLGEEKGYPLQCSGLENSTDCMVHGGHKELDTTDQLSLSLCFILGDGRDVTFLKVRAGNPLYILKAMRINTNRSKIVLPCSHDCIFSGANKFEYGNLRNRLSF